MPTAAAITAQPPRDGALLLRLESIVSHLAPAEQRVGERLLADPAAAAEMSITQLARACAVSETTVVRFCRHTGLGGYRALRLALVAETARPSSPPRAVLDSDIGRDDPLERVVATVGAAEARAIEETVAQLDTRVLERVVAAVAAAARVQLFGVGASALVAEDLQQKLGRVGRAAFLGRDPHAALTSAALLREDDVAIGISHSGATTDTIEPLALAGRRGAVTVALTNARRSRIAQTADHVLTTSSRETTFRSGAMASRTAQLVVTDCLFVGVAQRTYDESLAALALTRDAVRTRRRGRSS